MVGAAMAERELVRRVAGREAEELMAEADPEDRDAAHELAHGVDLRAQGLRVPGPFERRTPSKRASSSAEAVCGTTVTDAPAVASRRKIERFAP